jgi:diguanylate cyclase (GGDEF)-like protein
MMPYQHDDMRYIEPLMLSLDHLADGLLLCDTQSNILFKNHKFTSLFLSLEFEEDVQGMGFYDFLSMLVENGEFAGREVTENKAAWLRDQTEMLTAAGRVTLEWLLADGRILSVEATPLEGMYRMFSFRDITLQRRDKLLLIDALESTADGFAMWDQRGRLVRQNTRFAQRFEVENARPYIGMSFEKLLTTLVNSDGVLLQGESGYDWVQHILELRTLPVSDHIIQFSDKKYYLMHHRRTRDGGHTTALSDVTELKNKEAELRYRGQTLENALSEVEMSRAVLENQGEKLAALAEEMDQERSKARESELLLEKQEEKIRMLAESVPGVLYEAELKNSTHFQFTYISPKCQDFLGISAHDLMQHAGRGFPFVGDDAFDYARHLIKIVAQEGEYAFEGQIAMAGGAVRWFRDLVTSRFDLSGVVYVRGLLLDITEQKNMEWELRRLNVSDDLTHCLNRQALFEMAERETARYTRHGTEFSFLLLDLDHFKKVNASFGYIAGDEVLVAFSKCISDTLRTNDVMGRLGGEEFAIVLPNTDFDNAYIAGERIRQAVEGLSVQTSTGVVRFSVSIGVASAAVHGAGVLHLYEAAAVAVQDAKRQGRNMTCKAIAAPSNTPTP